MDNNSDVKCEHAEHAHLTAKEESRLDAMVRADAKDPGLRVWVSANVEYSALCACQAPGCQAVVRVLRTRSRGWHVGERSLVEWASSSPRGDDAFRASLLDAVKSALDGVKYARSRQARVDWSAVAESWSRAGLVPRGVSRSAAALRLASFFGGC